MGAVLGDHMQGYLLWQSQRRAQIVRILEPGANAQQRGRQGHASTVTSLSKASLQHAPLTIQEMSLDVAQHAVPNYVHAI